MIEVDKSEMKPKSKIWDAIKRLLCLLLPIAFSFLGYFLAPSIWGIFNKDNSSPEYFRFIMAIVFFIIPGTIIFIETRKLNPIIKITIKEKSI